MAQIFNGINVADMLPGGNRKQQYKTAPFENDDCNSMSSGCLSTSSSSSSSNRKTNKPSFTAKNHHHQHNQSNPLQLNLSNQMNKQQKLLWAQINRID